MKHDSFLKRAAVAAFGAAALTTGAETVFEENFRFYSDFTPAVTRDEGLQVGCDGVWELYAQLDCNATKPLDAFAKPVALPAGNKFCVTMVFAVRGDKKKNEPSFFDLVFIGKSGKRELVRIASDEIAGAKIPFLDGGWKNFGFRSNGKDVEIYLAVDRGHAFEKVATTRLKEEAAFFNIACTPGKAFSLKSVKVTTADEPLMSFPVEKHFADFRSLTQPIAGGTVAKGCEQVKIPLGKVAGLAFKMNATNATAELLFEGKQGGWKVSVGDFRKDKRDATVNFSVLGGHGGIEQWVRPNMRPFTENAETGQRGMVPAGYDVLREWNRTPSASQHVNNLDFVRNTSGAVDFYLDGSRVATIGADVKALVFKPGAGVTYRVKDCAEEAKIDRAKYFPIDLGVNPRAKALVGGTLSGVKPGFGTFGGAPVKVVGPIDSADVSICRQGKGNWALEVEEYHGRNPQQGFPMAIHYRVPAATYAKAHVVFALDPDPKKDPILTVRLGRYETNGVGGNMMGDTVLDFTKGVPESCKKIGEVKLADRTANVYYAEVPVNVGRIIDLACGDYLDFEFAGKGWENFQQLDNSMKPDPNSDSAFNILGVTLEKVPFNVIVREATPGNVFTADEMGRKTSVELVATAAGKGSVAWVARDFDGQEAFRGEKAWSAAKAGVTNRVDIALDTKEVGYFTLDVVFKDASGRDLFTHAASFGVLPEAGRKVSRHDSPYAIWWFNCHGSTGKAEVGGPLMQKAGIRKCSWNSMKQEEYDRYDATSCGNFMIPARHSCFDNATGKFKAGTYKGPDGKPVQAKDGEEWVVATIREQVSKMPKDAKPHLLVWHESAPTASVPEELLDEPVPAGKVYHADEWDAAYLNELARIVHKHFPGLPIQVGNSTWSIGAVVGPMRKGAKPESYDRIGIETPSQVVVPERMLDCGLQGMQITLDATEAIGGKRAKANGTWEFVYRCERDMGEKQQAEWYVRDILISLMHDFYLISPGIFFDCSSGYYNGLWGGSGLLRRSPWVYPKPAFIAYGVLTKALDGVTLSRQLDTGSTTVYAVEFKRLDGKFVTVLWASRGTVDFKVVTAKGFLGIGGGGGEVWQMLGAKSALAAGESVVKGGTSPVYLITEKPLESVAIAGRAYPKTEAVVKNAKVAAAFDNADEIELKPDPWMETTGKRYFFPVMKPCDEFTLETVEDETMGKCVELKLGPAKNPTKATSKSGKRYSDRYITRYTTLRLKEPKVFTGKPAVLGVWVKGDSNWGQVRFEIEDADGEVFKNQSTGRWWMCDIMDWPGNLAVNFDGWSYCYCSLLDNKMVLDRSPGLVAEQWVSEGGDKQMKFPVKLRAITVGMNREKLDLMDFKPATNVIRLKNAGGTEE